MDIWELLGIEPTKDIREIKKAFSEKAKTTHPEDDPEGFSMLRQAFRIAVNQAKAASDFTGEEQQEPTEYVQPEEVKPPVNTLGIDFDKQEENYQLDEDKIREKADKFLRRVSRYYNIKLFRKSRRLWENLFSSQDFSELKCNEDFTLRFLDYLMASRDFPPKIWLKTLEPLMVEWSYYWEGTNLGPYFKVACGLGPYHRNDKPFRTIKKRRGLDESTKVFGYLGFVMVVCFCMAVFGMRDASPYTQYGYGNTPVGDALRVYDASLKLKKSSLTELPLSADEVDLLTAEEDSHTKIVLSIAQGHSYRRVISTSKELGISSDDYDALAELYTGDSFDVDFTRAIMRFAPELEQAMRQTIWPYLHEVVADGEITDEAKPLMGCMGISDDIFDQLVQILDNEGQEGLQEVFEQEYYYFHYSFSVMKQLNENLSSLFYLPSPLNSDTD